MGTALLFLILISGLFTSCVAQTCSLPSGLDGNWTSSNLGTVTVASTLSRLTFSKVMLGQSASEVNEFDCWYQDGDKYVLKDRLLEDLYSVNKNGIFNEQYRFVFLDVPTIQ
ncbi:hypothetical protein DPMN_104027 [Dreissena polymorpha]|uniref:Uncharacterized protein n=1 Tax=Dreissena polymorpha TaxID=45954 RepID=A0A9D4HAU9_DREPO|nr:hypothetical protein DPMN_104027 [Dreissena polymorpha]